MSEALLTVPFLTIGVGGTLAILGGALALGIRHGIDWDHIAAIADITSASAVASEPQPLLASERAVLLSQTAPAWALDSAAAGGMHGSRSFESSGSRLPEQTPLTRVAGYVRHQRTPLFLGTMYAIGHGSMVIVLGLIAILFKEILPDWIDPIMERVVGVTLLVLAAYLFFSVFRYFRGGEFRLRSRWMLVFAGAGRSWRWAKHKVLGKAHEHAHHHATDRQYGSGTAYGIGLIHGVGAETGTQVLIIGAAVGAGSKGMSVATLLVFVLGLLISNSIVTIASTTGFISAQRRQIVYVAVGVVAAVFSLVVGLVFLSQSGDVLPSLDPFVRWIGGPD
jgi:high-affinity nickel-transport protein